MDEEIIENNDEEALDKKINELLYKSNLTFEQTQEFWDGLKYLEFEDKQNFIYTISEEPKMILIMYELFKKKLNELEEEDEQDENETK